MTRANNFEDGKLVPAGSTAPLGDHSPGGGPRDRAGLVGVRAPRDLT